jgi:hypothetical protein
VRYRVKLILDLFGALDIVSSTATSKGAPVRTAGNQRTAKPHASHLISQPSTVPTCSLSQSTLITINLPTACMGMNDLVGRARSGIESDSWCSEA